MTAATSPLWLATSPLLLASGSATRRLLLEGAGLPVEVRRPDVDERREEAEACARGADPQGVALHLARAKALDVSRRRPGRVVVGADQTLAIDGKALHKPADRAAAAAQLGRLAGRTHALHAAVAVALDGNVTFSTVSTARMTMRPLSEAMLARYLDAAGPAVLTSVGAYQWEGLGVHLFESVEGDHATILGLPLLPLLAHLRTAGWVAA